jgi:hypothetical protein
MCMRIPFFQSDEEAIIVRAYIALKQKKLLIELTYLCWPKPTAKHANDVGQIFTNGSIRPDSDIDLTELR